VTLAITTGLRRGEILGLKWSDINLDNATLSVCRTLEQSKAGLEFREPKTERSRRAVALPVLAVQALRKHRAEQARLRLKLGPRYNARRTRVLSPRWPPALIVAFASQGNTHDRYFFKAKRE
jgi:integrase